MSAPILHFDLETTGLSPERSRIVELAAFEGGGGPGAGDPPSTAYLGRFDPGVPIPPDAARVHGITDADVRGAPRFEREAPALQRLFEGRVLCGYNIRSFDTPLLDAELRRAGQPGLGLESVREIDLYRVWTAIEPGEARGERTLTAAVRRFLDRSHGGAHASAHDAGVLPRLLGAMREAFGLGEGDLLDLTLSAEEVDRAGKLRRAGGEVVFGFGRHAGEPVSEHPDYVDWILGADFPEETKRILRGLLGG